MARRTVTIGSRVGLHARPAALFVEAATASGIAVRIGRPGADPVPARSILSVLALGVKGGEEVTLHVDGEGADQVLDDLAALLVQDHDAPAETSSA